MRQFDDPPRRPLTHSRPNAWQMQALFTTLIYLTLILTTAVMGWMVVSFCGWAF